MSDSSLCSVIGITAILAGCVYGPPPIPLGDSSGWRVTQVVRFEGRQPYALVRPGLEIAFLHSFTGSDTWFHIEVQFQSKLEDKTKYDYRLSETWLRAGTGDFVKTNTFPCEDLKPIYNTHRGIYPNEAFLLAMNRKLPEVELVRPAPAFKANRGCIMAFLKTPYPPEGTPFVLRLGGLRQDGKPVPIPDVEFRYRP